jgi:hypothetical protein
MVHQVKYSKIAVLAAFVMLTTAGLVAAQESDQTAAPAAQPEFAGVVKAAVGKYFYLPTAKGYDIVVQGQIEGKDASSLAGKEIFLKGEALKDEPSLLVAETIAINEGGASRNIFTRAEEVKVDDYVGAAARATFAQLKITSADKAADWEGKGKGKVYGRLITAKSPAGQETYTISVLDEKDKEVGKIIVDGVTDFGKYYITKLHLFDRFWLYLNIKDTVDAKVRRKTRELFHADLAFAGLY